MSLQRGLLVTLFRGLVYHQGRIMITNPKSIDITVADPNTVERFEVQYYNKDNLACKLDIDKPTPNGNVFTLSLVELNRMAPRGVELRVWVACKQGQIRTSSTEAGDTVFFPAIPAPAPPTSVVVK